MTKLSARHAPLAQLDRASDYGSEGQEFESLRAYQKSQTERFGSFALCAGTAGTSRMDRETTGGPPRNEPFHGGPFWLFQPAENLLRNDLIGPVDDPAEFFDFGIIEFDYMRGDC